MNPRYFLDSDPDCNWVLVPTKYRRQWLEWIEANDYNAHFELPKYARLLEADLIDLTFASPRIVRANP